MVAKNILINNCTFTNISLTVTGSNFETKEFLYCGRIKPVSFGELLWHVYNQKFILHTIDKVYLFE